MGDLYQQEDVSPGTMRQGGSRRALLLPVLALLAVVALVSGLVFAGVVQGHVSRPALEHAPSTQSTVLIVP